MKKSWRSVSDHLLKETARKRRLFFLVADILLLSLSLLVSFWLRFEGAIPTPFQKYMVFYIALALIPKLAFLTIYRLYNVSWRFISLKDLFNAVKALSLGTLCFALSLFLFKVFPPFERFPRSIVIMDYLISMALIVLLRIAKRAYIENIGSALRFDDRKKKIIIIGAGNAGEQILRQIRTNKATEYFPIGFIDDDLAKKGVTIQGIKVLGNREDIPQLLKVNAIDETLIALPSVHSKEIKKIVGIIRTVSPNHKITILPELADILDGKVALSDIRDIDINDLLGRDPVRIDVQSIRTFIAGKKILVTGAAGSIGKEIARTILQFNPECMIALDIDETELFHLQHNLQAFASRLVAIVGDIKDRPKMVSIFDKYRPQIVIHSAAYKHVPLMELHPEEAVKTNILGTRVVGELALASGVEKFVLISTDKAISPTSVMGASKRTAEILLKILNQQQKTKFISVRFGNVLASRGSVVPIFESQIRQRKPVTVTHPEMKRYFMNTSEAVLLTLEASAAGKGGEVFVLDMGEQVKILDLAKEMIRLSGYEPDVDIPIKFTGIRPGEKLYEEIIEQEEEVLGTEFEKIKLDTDMRTQSAPFLTGQIDALIEISQRQGPKEEIIKYLQKIVAAYKPS